MQSFQILNHLEKRSKLKLLYIAGKQINSDYLRASELLLPHAIFVVSLLQPEENTSTSSTFPSPVFWIVKS
jgi:hypothetical protein